ncbi:putative accessory gene regulator protein [Clostridiales bacterium CHKCI001]|nr:putative accessory gene regulator protein [Clostridiales bacterium CHKCI001]
MIQKIVDTIIHKQMDEQVMSVENEKVYRYGYTLLCEVVLNLIIALIIGFIFGQLKITLFFLFMYIPLRSFCGGWHAKEIWQCTVISNSILLLQIYSKRYMLPDISNVLLIIFVICLLSILYISPVETLTKKISESEQRLYKKKIYCITVIQMVVLAILVLIGASEYIFSLVYVYVIQNVMLVLELIKNKLHKFINGNKKV